MAPSSTIYVCIEGECHKKCSDAVLVEIEELASAVNDVDCPVAVKESGCLGMCKRAPAAAVVVKKKTEQQLQLLESEERGGLGGVVEVETTLYFEKIDNWELSSRVALEATGREAAVVTTTTTTENNENKNLQTHLRVAREMRIQAWAEGIYRWNTALQAVLNQISFQQPSSRQQERGESDSDSSKEELLEIYTDVVEKSGFIKPLLSKSNHMPFNFLPTTTTTTTATVPEKISNYSPWRIERIEIQSSYTAIFYLSSTDRKRGSPHPRGGGRPLPKPITWHTTLLALVGCPNDNQEGPLPWIERDYTPVSTAKEWEQGKCQLLVKIWPQQQQEQEQEQAASSWLLQHGRRRDSPSNTPATVWLSQPLMTLRVPMLTTEDYVGCEFAPKSVLLLLAGTGIVAMSQILAHNHPYDKIGIPVQSSWQLRDDVPIDLIYACKEDDALMLNQIWKESQEEGLHNNNNNNNNNNNTKGTRGLRHCTLLLTNSNRKDTTTSTITSEIPFPEYDRRATKVVLDKLEALSNVRVLRGTRSTLVTPKLLIQSLKRMPDPCRVVVSGPNGFKKVVTEILLDNIGVDENDITVLDAMPQEKQPAWKAPIPAAVADRGS